MRRIRYRRVDPATYQPLHAPGAPSRKLRILAVMAVFSTACLLGIYYGPAAPTTLPAKGAGEQMTLCNRTITVPTVNNNGNDTKYHYGVAHWDRAMDRAVALPNRTGWPHVYGRTGNQIAEFFRIFDMARDGGGAVVLHDGGFPVDLTLKKLYLGIDRTMLKDRLGVVFYDELDEGQREKVTVIPTDEAYYYISLDARFSVDDAIHHRHYVIQELYRATAREMERHPASDGATAMCASLRAFFGTSGTGQIGAATMQQLNITHPISQKYAVIHSRGLEERGKEFLQKAHEVFGVDARAAFEYPADMLRSILAPGGMDDDGSTIVMISDGQNREVIDRLSSAFGSRFLVVPEAVSTLTGDLMLAILSDVFVGNPVSTFSQYIAQVRYALGIGNSYLFAKKDGEGRWTTFCNDEECFYRWLRVWVPLFPNPYKTKKRAKAKKV